jgi:hypothetical protein
MSMLTANTPVMFSTPAERRLLNALASLGFDTAQIVHSVLSYACDSAGAIWWMLRKKEEKMILEEVQPSAVGRSVGPDTPLFDTEAEKVGRGICTSPKLKKKKKNNAGIQTEPPPKKRSSWHRNSPWNPQLRQVRGASYYTSSQEWNSSMVAFALADIFIYLCRLVHEVSSFHTKRESEGQGQGPGFKRKEGPSRKR